jgi:hypothetical protein
MTTTAVRNSPPAQPAGSTAQAEVQTSSPSPAGVRAEGLHNRKLRVMARCSEIAPDKTHPAHKFQYVSIQNLSNHLRRFCAEEGLDIVTSITDGTVVVELINADKPDEKSVSTWPVVAGDKGFAFSIKFPLMRLFLIGDGEENDEAELASASGRAAVRPLPPARATPPANAPAAPMVRPNAPTPATAVADSARAAATPIGPNDNGRLPWDD